MPESSVIFKRNTASQARSNPPATPIVGNFRRDYGFFGGRWRSFRAALSGAGYMLRTQPNAWIELAATAAVVGAGWWLEIDRLEWALLALVVAGVLAMEAVNTAVEAVVDLISPQYHPLAKIAKDAAAGAMIFAVAGSLFVAAAIFGPRLWGLVF